ncbi:MAG: CPBP family intramembrane metalloprotease [Flavobacteriales bacterium]|nr:CPBP family intramembrane metalloprotease [Flavobacteriales bacterium]
MSKRLAILALVTLVGFPILGFIILYFFDESPGQTMVRSQSPILLQLATGAGIGTLIGLGGKWIISRPFLSAVSLKYGKLIQNFKISSFGIWFVSFCAGFGEELLFRGAIQPLLGVWITAVIFVAIHGYLNPRDLKISLYGIFMTIAIAGLGYLTEHMGIWAAASAHMMIDVVLFYYLNSVKAAPKKSLNTAYEV